MNYSADDIVIVHCDIFTCFGAGIEPAWEALKQNRHGFVPLARRIDTESLSSCYGALAPELDKVNSPSDYLLDYAARSAAKFSSDRTALWVGTTVGEIEYLHNPERRCTSDSLLEKAAQKFNIADARCLSAACASSNMSLCRAGAALRAHKCDCAVVYAVDFVSEFTASGFLTLKAMTTGNCARPYDKQRSGILLGDGAGVVVMTRAETARKMGYEVLAKVSAWGMSCDAGHITSPQEDGNFLAEAGRKMLERACVSPEDVGAVIGHGTGTYHNDIMEIKALKKLFSRPVPLFSTKGSTGHTLAAAGVMQTAAAVMMLKERVIPPQTSISDPEEGAQEMVSDRIRTLDKPRIIAMNAGFGGLNAALLYEGAALS